MAELEDTIQILQNELGNFVANRVSASQRYQKFCCGPTPSEPPRALQASECSELLDPTRASCLILAQRQPGKLLPYESGSATWTHIVVAVWPLLVGLYFCFRYTQSVVRLVLLRGQRPLFRFRLWRVASPSLAPGRRPLCEFGCLLSELSSFRFFANSAAACQSRRFPIFSGSDFASIRLLVSLAPRSASRIGLPDSGLPLSNLARRFPFACLRSPPALRIRLAAFRIARAPPLCEFGSLLPAAAVRRLADPQRRAENVAPRSLLLLRFASSSAPRPTAPISCVRIRPPDF